MHTRPPPSTLFSLVEGNLAWGLSWHHFVGAVFKKHEWVLGKHFWNVICKPLPSFLEEKSEKRNLLSITGCHGLTGGFTFGKRLYPKNNTRGEYNDSRLTDKKLGPKGYSRLLGFTDSSQWKKQESRSTLLFFTLANARGSQHSVHWLCMKPLTSSLGVRATQESRLASWQTGFVWF